MKQRADNYIWIRYKKEVNNLNINIKKPIYAMWHEQRYLDVMIKLGYIERVFAPNQHYLGNDYMKLKNIPEELRWMEALKLSKTIPTEKKGRKKYSFFNKIIEKLNSMDIGQSFQRSTFGKVQYNSLTGYLSLLTRLEYVEKVPERGTYKFVKRVPDGLTTTLANKMLTDKFYKRVRKLQKLREKLNGNN